MSVEVKCENDCVGRWLSRFGFLTAQMSESVVRNFFHMSNLKKDLDWHNHPLEHRFRSEICRPHCCWKSNKWLKDALQIQIRMRIVESKSGNEKIIFKVDGQESSGCILHKALIRVVGCKRYTSAALEGVKFTLNTSSDLGFFVIARDDLRDILPTLPSQEVSTSLPPLIPLPPPPRPPRQTTPPRPPREPTPRPTEGFKRCANEISRQSFFLPKRRKRETGQVSEQPVVPKKSCFGCRLNLPIHEAGCLQGCFEKQ